MALDSSGKQQQQRPRPPSSKTRDARLKLRRTPNEEHEPENYEDLPLDFSPALFSSLERYLPEKILNSTRIEKARFMSELLQSYSPATELNRVKLPSFYLCCSSFPFLEFELEFSSWEQIQRHREYRQRILSSYQVKVFIFTFFCIWIVSLNLASSDVPASAWRYLYS